ncbi:hypothetical protein GCM10028825_05690 [Spirosoma agri]
MSGSVIAQQYPQRLILDRSTITSGDQRAVEAIIASNQLRQGATAHYTAGQSITLQPGFVAQAGSVFTATVSVVSSTTSREGSDLSARAYPNPFIDQTTIEYRLPLGGSVRHRLTDAKGQEIRQLEAISEQSSGVHQLQLEGSALPAGVYLYQLQVGPESRTLRLIKRP